MNKQTVLIIVVLVLMYLVMGASIFQILEQPYEVEQKRLIVNEKNKFISSHSCVDSQDLAGFIRHVMTAMDSGVDPIGNWSNTSKNWDLGSSFFFSGTVITTIGFGSTAPKSKWGRIFCVFYALVGIPMFGFLLAGVGELLGSALGNLISKVEYIVLRWKVSATVVRVISTLVSILIGCLIFMVTPVLVFEHIEEWSVLEAIYFVVITLTTIGFGDYVAGKNPQIEYRTWYLPLVWLWIIVGLAYFAAILSMIGDWLRVLSEKTKAEMGGLTAQAATWTQHITRGQGREITAGHRLSSDRAVHVPSDPEEGREGSLQQTHLEPLQEVSGPPIDFTIQGLTYIDATPGSSPGDLPTPTAAISPARSPGLGPSLRLNPGQWLRRSRRNLTSRLGFSEDGNRTRDKGESV
eukprot:gi/632990619/ref/XP_007884250.1/ PREDICTED: potassium channel subfamily K member 2-like [Callorhinchus milii]